MIVVYVRTIDNQHYLKERERQREELDQGNEKLGLLRKKPRVVVNSLLFMRQANSLQIINNIKRTGKKEKGGVNG